MHTEYAPDLTGAEIQASYAEADRRVDAEKQARMEAKATIHRTLTHIREMAKIEAGGSAVWGRVIPHVDEAIEELRRLS